jgi:hypothetical protein
MVTTNKYHPSANMIADLNKERSSKLENSFGKRSDVDDLIDWA